MQQPNLIEAFQMGMHAILRFMGLLGEWIVSYPNGVFYILILLGCILIPPLAIIIVISFLSWAWSGGCDGGWNY